MNFCELCGSSDGISYTEYNNKYYCDEYDCQMSLSEIVYNDRYVLGVFYPEIYIEGEYTKNLPNEIKKLEEKIGSGRKK